MAQRDYSLFNFGLDRWVFGGARLLLITKLGQDTIQSLTYEIERLVGHKLGLLTIFFKDKS
ncbi:MAG TPA: hypothetical protein DCM25_10120 [Rhodobacteraceae bacterium]|nr:hypothetical protein [Paracoccaceae bacterium]